jgi:hypothetical protein
MHFEILVEDQSGKKALDILVPKIVGDGHTFKIHAYKGIGRIPKDLGRQADASKRILLEQLPKLLRGYGNTFARYPDSHPAAVIVVCDLDDRCLKAFRHELLAILHVCDPKPEARFCIAIEEGEAWFLGDTPAIKAAYPRAKEAILNAYKNDSICGTWECLADAVCLRGSRALSDRGWQAIGAEKSEWSEKIAPHMDVLNNSSPSFNYFREKILNLAGLVM